MICLFLSVFFWFLITFSKDYISTVVFPLSYQNTPKYKVVVNRLPSTIDVDINASGFTILYYKLLYHSQPVKIDLKELKPSRDPGIYFMAINTKLEKLSRQFGNRIKALKVVPDTLFVNYSKRINKTVPVKLNGVITYNKDYQLKDSIHLLPSKVLISGPEEQVNEIKYAETEAVKLEDVDHNIRTDVRIMLSNDSSLIDVSNPTVQLIVPVTKVTEETMEIPIQVDNLPKGYSLKTFPDKVSVKFVAPFDEFKKMDASSFRVRVDYLKKTNSRKLRIELVKKPPFVKALKINPEKVEFIVHK